MTKLLFLNTETLIGALFWCNLTMVGFLSVYYYKNHTSNEKPVITRMIFAKLSHALAYFCLFGRGLLPNWLSVNIGNTALFLGFYFEAHVILSLVRGNDKTMRKALSIILSVSILAFNIVELFIPKNGLRVTIASLCVVLIVILPNLKMLFSPDSSSYAKFTAILYILLILLLLPRAWHSLVNQDVGILSSTIVQSLTFEALLIILLFSTPSYILIMKEYSDDALMLMATTDKVTGATNRHAFSEAASAVFENYVRLKLPVSVLVIDIDWFKNVNDAYGHPFGDIVLNRLATLLDDCLRRSDLSCRYGGDEFVALLAQADENSAQLVADRIIQKVRELSFSEHEDFGLTVSIGVYSNTPVDGQTVDIFAQYADEALYHAKASGRDRVVFYKAE